MRIEIMDPWVSGGKVQHIWQELIKYDKITYFLTWGWIENWLTSLKEFSPKLKFLVYYSDSEPICAFFLGECKRNRHKIIRNRCLFLNMTGIPEYDEISIEYNLMPRKLKSPIQLSTIISEIPQEWDEIIMHALDEKMLPGVSILDKSFNQSMDYNIIIESVEPAPYVDLNKVRSASDGYVALLGRNTRYAIRKSYREYEKKGSIVTTQAADQGAALQIFDELVALHQKSWNEKGYPGAFGSNYLYGFHKDLIKSRFKYGEIQLLKICCGKITIGCLYNFVHENTVLQYQSGINYKFNSEKNLHPGIICMAEGIVHNALANNSIFDFMAGSYEYKRRMSTNEKKIIYAKIQKRRLKYIAENKLSKIYSFFKKK